MYKNINIMLFPLHQFFQTVVTLKQYILLEQSDMAIHAYD